MSKQEKFFNTVGSINPEDHYFLPHRLDQNQLMEFIEKKYYFILHAPRQSGKTTAVMEFVNELNKQGKHVALYASAEAAHCAVNDIKRASFVLLEYFKSQIAFYLPKETEALTYLDEILQQKDISENSIYYFLSFWAAKCIEKKTPLLVFFDEFDGLVGESLVSLLKQFRLGYIGRPKPFPQMICLIGVRDLRDYKVKTKEQEELGILYSPFNVKSDSVILPDFSLDNVKTLYSQHTQETGQVFTEEAVEYAYEQTRGQPWLVNALAYQACFRDVKDRSTPITKEVMEKAREALIKRCDTHMDALLDRLNEPRVRGIIDILLSSSEGPGFAPDDLQYVRDLGLISKKEICIANPIYQEIIPRTLAHTKQEEIMQQLAWYQKEDGLLDVPKLLTGFTEFYRENSEIWLERFDYKEAGPHLLLLAFLQRIINGGGTIHREYALGRKRVDLLITWKTQRFVIELKVYRTKKDIEKGLKQTAEYMDKTGTPEGYLIVFDRNSEKSWTKKIYHKTEKVEEKRIEIWGM
ncbi:MAG: AAA-like domain-containing protein [Chlamydiota bacterium]